MKKITLFYVTMILLYSCSQNNDIAKSNDVISSDSIYCNENKNKLTNKTIKFLWRELKYDEELKDTILSICLNKNFLKNISEPEKAAIGFVATFIGNDCWWDGEANENRSNLKCEILKALNLGYQCSDTHLGFLREWFRNDQNSLAKLNDCTTIPYTSSIQDTFEEIILSVDGNKIVIFFKASGINTREGYIYRWSEINKFNFYNGSLKLIENKSTTRKFEHFTFN